MMCEPLLEKKGMNVYALMQITVVAESKGLSDGIHAARRIFPAPSLIDRP